MRHNSLLFSIQMSNGLLMLSLDHLYDILGLLDHSVVFVIKLLHAEDVVAAGLLGELEGLLDLLVCSFAEEEQLFLNKKILKLVIGKKIVFECVETPSISSSSFLIVSSCAYKYKAEKSNFPLKPPLSPKALSITSFSNVAIFARNTPFVSFKASSYSASFEFSAYIRSIWSLSVSSKRIYQIQLLMIFPKQFRYPHFVICIFDFILNPFSLSISIFPSTKFMLLTHESQAFSSISTLCTSLAWAVVGRRGSNASKYTQPSMSMGSGSRRLRLPSGSKQSGQLWQIRYIIIGIGRCTSIFDAPKLMLSGSHAIQPGQPLAV